MPYATIAAPAGLRMPGTGGYRRLAYGVLGMGWRQVLRQKAGQRVKQEMPGAEVSRGRPDAPAGDELQGSRR
jgi:hypothetical protein